MIAIKGLDMPNENQFAVVTIWSDGDCFTRLVDGLSESIVDKTEAVEIVPCKECKYHMIQADGLNRCTGWDRLVNAEHFCGFGERRTDEYTD